MSKIIESPVPQFKGTVTLFQPLTYPQYIEWDKTAVKRKKLMDEGNITDVEMEWDLWNSVKPLVEKWDLKNFNPENITPVPRIPIIKLLTWLINEIGIIINEDIDPNA